jgi:hypothetical protein
MARRNSKFQYTIDLANGTWVFCPKSGQEERTADGFCSACGATDHEPTN